ncbi:MAG: hypothetical protein ABSC63_16670 [Candidatus Binataceae bacterium]|jgi:hypothetical protein
MKTLALLLAVSLVGCGTTSSHTTATTGRLTDLYDASEAISDRNQQCVKQAVIRSPDQTTWIASAAPTASAGSQMQKAKDESDHEILDCETIADREKAQLSARERAEYEDEAQQAHDGASVMMILTISRPH